MRNWGWVLFFLAPSLLGLIIFIVYPITSSFWVAFHDWNLLSPPEFIGFANFRELWADRAFWRALRYTLLFIVMYVPSVFVLGLALALLLNTNSQGFPYSVLEPFSKTATRHL